MLWALDRVALIEVAAQSLALWTMHNKAFLEVIVFKHPVDLIYKSMVLIQL